MLIIPKQVTIPRTKLRKGGALVASQGFLHVADGWGLDPDERVRAKDSNGIEDSFRMNSLQGGFEVSGWERAIREERGDNGLILGKERMLHLTRAGVRGKEREGTMVRLKGHCQELGPQHMNVGLHREFHNFVVEVADWRGHMATSNHSQGRILDLLKPMKRGRRRIWSPHRSGIVYNRFD